jgi:hypothetical protein
MGELISTVVAKLASGAVDFLCGESPPWDRGKELQQRCQNENIFITDLLSFWENLPRKWK